MTLDVLKTGCSCDCLLSLFKMNLTTFLPLMGNSMEIFQKSSINVLESKNPRWKIPNVYKPRTKSNLGFIRSSSYHWGNYFASYVLLEVLTKNISCKYHLHGFKTASLVLYYQILLGDRNFNRGPVCTLLPFKTILVWHHLGAESWRERPERNGHKERT